MSVAKSLFPLKPSHKPVKAYYDALALFQKHGHTTESNTRACFADLLKKCYLPYHSHLFEEYAFKGTAKQSLRAEGALVDDLTLVYGISGKLKTPTTTSPKKSASSSKKATPHQPPLPVPRPRRSL